MLVTGIGDPLGLRVAQRLAALPSVERVVGVDAVLPRRFADGREGAVEFVRADIRNPLIAKVIATAEVDTVVHTTVDAAVARSSSRTASKELTVLGSMRLLAACQQAPDLRRFVHLSTTAVYGSGPRDPAVFTEQMDAGGPGGGPGRDAAEVEEYVRGFARRRTDVAVTVLRLADVVGPELDTPLLDYLTRPVVATVLGRDPRFQLLHVEDAVTATVHLAGRAGTWNVAGAGVLTVSQALRRSGAIGVAVPAPLVGPLGLVARRTPMAAIAPRQWRGSGRVVDTSAIERETGFVARWSTEQAFDDVRTGKGRRGPLERLR